VKYDIKIDVSRDALFDELGLKRLKESYMLPSEVSPQERYAFVSSKFASDQDHAQRLYDYSSSHWLSYSTPILSYGRSKKGLPISCFLNSMEDTTEGLINTMSETAWLSVTGGGVGTYVGIRSSDDKSVGVMPHLKVYDFHCLAYKQGTTRRGSYASYLDINHPDILQFIEMRKPTGDQNVRCTNLHHGINITDDFMKIIENCMRDPDFDDSWSLHDPASSVVVNTVSAKYLWQMILETRMQTGEPYLHFIDTANAALPVWLKDKGLKIKNSNLCAEIELPVSSTRTAVCCLSSLNMDYYDAWKDDSQFIKDVAEMLDNVLDVFCEDAGEPLWKAVNSAKHERSIGVGVLGFHSYLQSKGIPFESPMAFGINLNSFKLINDKLKQASKALAEERGEAPDAVGYGHRFSHTMAVAPTASSSIIMGNTSPSIEPYRANGYRQDTLSGSYFQKNKHLDKLLKSKLSDEEYATAWATITTDNGSAQSLTCLSDWEKDVFKTAMEIDQAYIIEMAAARAQLIDQGQSVNLFFMPNTSIAELHKAHFSAWKKGLKSLYYCRSDKIKKGDKISQKVERVKLDEECIACGS
jgi:ribonucleoside-diphosphate reductase alpha chain